MEKKEEEELTKKIIAIKKDVRDTLKVMKSMTKEISQRMVTKKSTHH